MRFWCLVHNDYFSEKKSLLRKWVPLSKCSHRTRLSKFFDEHKVLRIGGRLYNSQLSFNKRHAGYDGLIRVEDTRMATTQLGKHVVKLVKLTIDKKTVSAHGAKSSSS